MHAATFTVNIETDSVDANPGNGTCADAAGFCSLRAAIIEANALAGPDTIQFSNALNGTPIVLSISSGGGTEQAALSGDLDINSSITITGNGSSNTVITTNYTSACGDCKVFGVNQTGLFPGLMVGISGVKISGGFNNGTNFCGSFFETGGGIDFFLTGTGNNFSIANSIITGNTATGCAGTSHGGGLNVDSANEATPSGASAGTVTLTDITVSGNTASAYGGGIVLAADKHNVTITNLTVTGNSTSDGDGGGIWIRHSFGGTVSITGGSVSTNSGTQGGGISVVGNQVLTITDVTISGNTATGAVGTALGGGIIISTLGASGVTGSTTLTNLTITSNHADAGTGGGGGVYFGGFYPAALNNCTISSNTSKRGAGVLHGGSTATPTAQFTITGGAIRSNTATGDGITTGFGGALLSIGTGTPDPSSVTTLTNVAIGGTTGGQGNTAVDGGAIANLNTSVVTMVGGSIVGNASTGPAAGTGGGGVFVSGGAVTLRNLTIANGTANGRGGALFSTGGASTLTNVTIAGNRSDNNNSGSETGGGISRTGGTMTLENTLVGGNFRGTGVTADDVNGAVTANFSLIQTTTGATISGANNVLNADPRLGVLGVTFGGGVPVIPLLGGSPAIDAGSNALVPVGINTDARGTGFARIKDGGDADLTDETDIGAYEAHPAVEDIPDKTTPEDTPISFAFNIGDVDLGFTSITATSDLPGVMPNPVISGSGSSRTLAFTPVANQFGTPTVTVTVTGNENGQPFTSTDTFVMNVTPVADTPSVTNTTTDEDTQSTTGLVLERNVVDGSEVTHFKILNIVNGTVYKPDGVTAVPSGQFVTYAEGHAGLKFTPSANFFGTASFDIQAATGTAGGGTGLSSVITATITVVAVADPPQVTPATTNEDTPTTSGLVISRNAVDGAEVTHFKITSIANGTLFQNDGTTPIANGEFLTFAQANAGLRFTPAADFFGTASFVIQGATSAGGAGLGAGTTASITVNPIADTPSISNATTNEDTQSTSGLVVQRNAADGTEVTHFKITGITGGTLFQSDGTTPIANGAFITFTQANAGLKFTPAANTFGTGHITVQASLSDLDAGLGGSPVTADIVVNPVADTPSVTNATTIVNHQTTSGLVISRNAVDGTEVTHFKITSISGGTLFQNDGATPIGDGTFITFAEANAGLRFTPATDSLATGHFSIQASISAADAGLGGAIVTADITVTKNTTSTTITADTPDPSNRNVAYPIAVTVTSTSGGPTPTGTVSVSDGTNTCTITLDGAGQGACSLTPATGGNYTITATYNGDAVSDTSGDTEPHVVNNCPTNAVVTTTADSGAGSLRQAIADACTTDSITFDLGAGPHTIGLTSGTLTLTRDLTITGPGANLLTVARSSGSFRVFDIAPGHTVTLDGLTIANGIATAGGTGGFGGGIYNDGSTLTIANSTLSGNTAAFGGAVYSTGDNFGSVSTTLVNSTLSGNTANGNGGALYHIVSTSNGTLTIANTTLSGNSAFDDGGGVFLNLSNDAVLITNATITGNRADSDDGANGREGAGGGLFINAGSTDVEIRNSLVAGNFHTSGPARDDISGDLASASAHNLIGVDTGLTGIVNGTNGNQIGSSGSPLDPKIGALASNGGPTSTHALLFGSPALDAGDNALAAAAGLTTDQRGEPRASDSADADTTDTVDIGAFEARAAIAALPDRAIGEDGVATATFDVGDGDLITSVVASSSNTTLVPNNIANLSFTGSGNTRTLTIAPAANAFGTADITVTVFSGSDQMSDTLQLIVSAAADTPSVAPATTNEDTQTTSGLVISRNAADGAEVTHFKITSITGGALFQNDGTTAIANGAFITFAEGNAGLKFTPAANATATGHFSVQSSIGGSDLGLGGAPAVADIFINPTPDTPSVTNATTNEDTPTASGLVISPNAADGVEVTHFKITGITGGALFQNDGATPIGENAFITVAQGGAGLRFTPAANSIATGHFTAQASVSNADAGLGGGLATADIFVTPIGDAPGITSATTNEDTQSTSGLVLSRNAADGTEVTHFKITAITNGSLFKTDGTTPIANGDVITVAEGNAGLKFTPTANFFGNASFIAQGATSAAGAGTGAGTTAAITVDAVADTPSVTNASTPVNTQTTSGLVISRNGADGSEVTHFKITTILGGALFKNDGTTPIGDGTFITFADGNAGLKFTPTLNSFATGHFTVQAAVNATDGGLGGGTAIADISVGGLPSSTSVTTSGTPSSFGQPVTFTATVSPIGAGSSGSVQFRDGGTTLGAPVSITSGIATLTTSSLSAGVHIITAEYSGNATYQASVGTLAGGQFVKAPTTTVVGSAPNPSTPGQTVTFTATVAPTSATGTMTFREGPATLGTVPLAAGVATFTTSSLSTGPHTIVADYSGDGAFSPSSGSVDHVVGCPTITVAPATLSAPAFGLPYGPITFTQTGGSGSATFALTGALPTGLTFNAGTATLSGTATSTGTFTVTVTATDANGCTGSRSYTFTVATTIAVSATPSVVNFGAVANGASVSPVTPPQSITLTQASGTPIAWTVSVDQPWLSVSPSSGSGAGIVTVSIVNPPAPDNLPATGARTGTITFTTTGAANSPTVAVNLTLLTAAQLTGPIGSFDTPANGQTNVTGSIGVTGWAVDDLGATTVEIWRAPIAGEGAEVFLGFGTFVTGARPDIAALFPTTPYFQRAGWGYLLLTNMLPNRGNGTFTLRAYAKDVETNRVLLGQKTITCTNATATAPFGAIDTPEPGGTASGTLLNFGWVLAAQPTASGLFIPIDGSTIHVFVDGVDRGAVDSYNNPRPDIQALFPGYFNTDGAVGVKFVDTTTFANGTHTIAWLATDNLGNAAGIGSRFFTIANSAAMATTIAAPTLGTGEPDVIDASTAVAGSTTDLEAIDRGNTAIAVRHGFDDQADVEIVTPNAMGVHTVRVAPLDRVAIELGPAHDAGATYRGYAVDGDVLRDLPIGSTLDPHTGEFVWTPGVGFGGTHELVFVREAGGGKQQIRITVTIANP